VYIYIYIYVNDIHTHIHTHKNLKKLNTLLAFSWMPHVLFSDKSQIYFWNQVYSRFTMVCIFVYICQNENRILLYGTAIVLLSQNGLSGFSTGQRLLLTVPRPLPLTPSRWRLRPLLTEGPARLWKLAPLLARSWPPSSLLVFGAARYLPRKSPEGVLLMHICA